MQKPGHSSALPAPSTPGYRGPLNSKTVRLLNSSTATVAADFQARAAADLGANPERSRRFASLAEKLLLCARSSAEHWGWRCGLAVCPRCECRKAIRYRERMEARLRKPETAFAFVTATLATDDLHVGARVLTRAFAELKRRAAWTQAVAGGESHLHVKPSGRGTVRAFNLHVHAVVELKAHRSIDSTILQAHWVALLAKSGAVGSLDVKPIRKHWAIFHG